MVRSLTGASRLMALPLWRRLVELPGALPRKYPNASREWPSRRVNLRRPRHRPAAAAMTFMSWSRRPRYDDDLHARPELWARRRPQPRRPDARCWEVPMSARPVVVAVLHRAMAPCSTTVERAASRTQPRVSIARLGDTALWDPTC